MSNILWSTSQVVHNPGHQGGVYLHRCQLAPLQGRPDVVERIGDIKEHNSHSATWPVQVSIGTLKQEDDGVIHSHLWLVGKLKGVQ